MNGACARADGSSGRACLLQERVRREQQHGNVCDASSSTGTFANMGMGRGAPAEHCVLCGPCCLKELAAYQNVLQQGLFKSPPHTQMYRDLYHCPLSSLRYDDDTTYEIQQSDPLPLPPPDPLPPPRARQWYIFLWTPIAFIRKPFTACAAAAPRPALRSPSCSAVQSLLRGRSPALSDLATPRFAWS